jgi:transcriptional regulator with XRE-family HTH domain
MNFILAKNVRALREIKHWTQHHLADAAGIQLRTVQRVESGDGASVDTLGALANAFGVSIDILQAEFAALADEVQRKYEEFWRDHDTVQIAPVACSSDFGVLDGAQGSVFHCFLNDDAVHDAFARLQSDLRDMIDLWDDVDPTSRRSWMRSAFEQVEELANRGVVIGAGRLDRVWRQVPFRVHYVVAMPKDDVRAFTAVEKDMNAYAGCHD